MIPPFDASGVLPLGTHPATWEEIRSRFGGNEWRAPLVDGLFRALVALREAGCRVAYIDGSFVTSKPDPGDFDGCWHLDEADLRFLDPTLFDFEAGRRAQKRKYGGEFFPAEFQIGPNGETALELFQREVPSGREKGIVVIDLGELP
jgi:hypothetical protein